MIKRLCVAVVVVLVGAQAHAIMVSKGCRELAVSGMLDETSDVNLYLNVQAGKFVRDFVQVGLRGMVDMADGGDVIVLGGGAFGEYHMPIYDNPLLLPYVGASASALFASIDTGASSSSSFAIEVAGSLGAKYFIVDNLAIGSAFELKLATDDVYLGNEKYENFKWMFTLATRFFF